LSMAVMEHMFVDIDVVNTQIASVSFIFCQKIRLSFVSTSRK